MERANLKTRRPELYERLESSWYAWNEGMLPEVDESTTGAQTGQTTADRPGAVRPSGKADNPPPKKKE